MKKAGKIREYLYTVLFMATATFVTVSSVSALHVATKDIVEQNEALFLKRAILKSANISLPENAAETALLFDRTVTRLEGNRYSISGATNLTAFLRSGPGLWGHISAVVCIDPSAATIAGLSFTEHNETPGLGARIEEDWFQEQFRGKKAPVRLQPEGTRSGSSSDIDAITGATITSRAVRDIVNLTLEEYADAQPSSKKTE